MEAYVKIADALPRFDRYSASFSQHDFQNVLALVYVDIIEFHRRAYKFFRRKGTLTALSRLRRALLCEIVL